MSSAIQITADHGYGRVGQWMKKCSCCGKNFIGSPVVERFFGKAKTADGHNYQCKRCLKERRDAKRARSKQYLADRKQLTGCENPLCECTPNERVEREARLEHHHLDPTTKKFNPASGTEKPIAELIDEVHQTIVLCKWSHDQTKGYRGALSECGVEMAKAREEEMSRYRTSRMAGAGGPRQP